jgi:hypothetical protein
LACASDDPRSGVNVNPDAPVARLRAPRVAAAILLIAGLGLVVLTVVVERHQEKIFAGALHTTGNVVAMLPKRSTSGSTTYAPVVRYRTNDGTTRDFTSSVASNPPSYKIGDPVPVVYPPLNPRQADVDSWTSRWLLTLLCGGLALGFAVLGGLGLMWNR